MLSRRTDPIPLAALRDCLGIARAMFEAERRAGATKARLERVARVGRMLTVALDEAASTRPGTVGHFAAWQRAEQATAALVDLVEVYSPAEPLVRASVERVKLRR